MTLRGPDGALAAADLSQQLARGCAARGPPGLGLALAPPAHNSVSAANDSSSSCTSASTSTSPPSPLLSQLRLNGELSGCAPAGGQLLDTPPTPTRPAARPTLANSGTSRRLPRCQSSQPYPITDAAQRVPRPLLPYNKSASAVPTLSTETVRSTGSTTPISRPLSSPNMTGTEGVNPHSAADLLRQAMMQRAAADDPEDQIGSNSSTPPGAATPRPDPTDKRLPGILHTYFGQNTPPQTPRTRSHEGKAASTPSGQTNSAAVRPPKGKLTVTISEGRNIKPSVDPYVVCQFQWAEYISEGPKNNDLGKQLAEGLGRNGSPALAIKRTDSDMGRPMAIPMRSRQSSNSGQSSDPKDPSFGRLTSNPRWDHKAIFDVVGDHSEIDVSVYDRSKEETFLGHVRFCPNLMEYEQPLDGWFALEPREGESEEHVSGEVHLLISFHKTDKRHYGPEDFQILKLIGKGTFGQVFQVRKKDTKRIYAMKVLSKKVIVQKKEVAHTLGERNILVRTATSHSPFIVGLKFSFQTPSDLYLVTDYMSGGELFWHLQREGRFHEARAKFYIAELILALQHLHEHDIVYRDLKPENILLDANGHIVLCDFGLSKANLSENDTTNTFCGTTEYLAPEVLLDEHGYTKMVDFWSLGVLVFEMCCGWSPFYAEDTQQMYKNIAFGKVRFPRDALSTEGRNFVKGLLNRNPRHRLGATRDAEELKAHPFFADVDWDALTKKNVVPPFKPKLKSELDTSNFDPEFTNALSSGAGSLNARAAALASGVNPASTPLSPTMQANFKGFTFVDESAMERQFRDRDGELDRMDEDETEERAGWRSNKPFSHVDRMSGVIPSNDNDDSFFSNGKFDE